MNAMTKPSEAAVDLAPLRDFIVGFGALVDGAQSERSILQSGAALLEALVARDGWLPDAYAQPAPDRYRQYLLHCDSAERFSVVSFVWGPGQATPVHDHRVWGLVGVLRGTERVQRYARSGGALTPLGEPHLLHSGEVDGFGPETGDFHQVANGRSDGPSVSIHVYGGNIGAVHRATYDETGQEKPFVSGYSNDTLPNLWNRSIP